MKIVHQSLLKRILNKIFVGVIEVPKFTFVLILGIFLAILFSNVLLLLPTIFLVLFILEFDKKSKEFIHQIYEINVNDKEEEIVGYWIYCQGDDKEIHKKVVPVDYIGLYFTAFPDKRPTEEEFNNWKKQILKK